MRFRLQAASTAPDFELDDRGQSSAVAPQDTGGLQQRRNAPVRSPHDGGRFTSLATTKEIPRPPAALDLVQEHEDITTAARELNQAFLHPNELADYTVRSHFVGFLAEATRAGGVALANGFSVWAREHAEQRGWNPTLASAIAYAIGASVFAVVYPDAASFLTRKLGGVEPKVYISTSSDNAPVGAYNELLGATAGGLAKFAVYGGISAGLESLPAFRGAARVGAAATSSVITAVVAQSMNYAAELYTRNSAGVASERDFGPLRHNHSLGRFVAVNTTPSPYTDRTTTPEKAKEVALRAMGAVANFLTFVGVQGNNPIDSTKHPGLSQLYTVFASFFAGQLVQAAASAIALNAYLDPAKHRQRYQYIANEILCRQLDQSVFELRAAALNEVGQIFRRLPADGSGDPALAEKQDMFAAASALMLPDSPARLKAAPAEMLPHIEALKVFFSEMAGRCRASMVDHTLDEEGSLGASSLRGSLERARELISFVTRDLIEIGGIAQGLAGGRNPEKFGHFFTDMVQRIRELSAVLLQADLQATRAAPADEISPSRKMLAELTDSLIPVLAGIRQGDRQANANGILSTLKQVAEFDGTEEAESPSGFIGLLSRITGAFRTPGDLLTRLAHDVRAAFTASASNRVYARDLLDVIEHELASAKPEARDQLRDDLTKALTTLLFADTELSYSAPRMRFLFAINGLARQKPGVVDATQDAIRELAAPQNTIPGAYPEADLSDFEAKILRGEVDLAVVANELAQSAPFPPVPRDGGDVEAAHGFQAGLDAIRGALGDQAVSALYEEAGLLAQQADLGRVLLNQFAQDVQSIHPVVRTLFEAGFMLDRAPGARQMDIEDQHDAHQHHDNFNGLTMEMENQREINDAVRIIAATFMGIPHQIEKPTRQVVYYGNNNPDNSWVYRGNETLYRNQELGDHVLSLTDLNLHVPEKVELEIINNLRNDSEQKITWIGEITAKKFGGVTDKAPRKVADVNEFAKYVFVPAARLGFGVTMHHDIGPAHGKLFYGKQILAALRSAVKDLATKPDPIKDAYPDLPAAQLKVIVPHFGMSPQNSGGTKLSLFWADALDDPTLKEALYLDASWSFTTKNLMNDIRDQLKAHSPMIALGLDNIAILYDAFLKQGTVADKNTDLGHPDEGAAHKVASDSIVELLAAAHDNFRKVVDHEFTTNGRLRDTLITMTNTRPDEHRNNWLYIFGKYPHRLLFGTDNLASEVKIHGQGELLADALSLHPVYALFKALEQTEVVEYVARQTWTNLFRNPALAQRRAAAREYYTEIKPSEARRAPVNVTRTVAQTSWGDHVAEQVHHAADAD